MHARARHGMLLALARSVLASTTAPTKISLVRMSLLSTLFFFYHSCVHATPSLPLLGSAPGNITVLSVNSTAAMLQWRQPDNLFGLLLGYYVHVAGLFVPVCCMFHGIHVIWPGYIGASPS